MSMTPPVICVGWMQCSVRKGGKNQRIELREIESALDWVRNKGVDSDEEQLSSFDELTWFGLSLSSNSWAKSAGAREHFELLSQQGPQR